MSIRVLRCLKCGHFHRELPDFIAHFKHLSFELIAQIYDGTVENPAVDGSTIICLRYGADWILKYGIAILKRLKEEHPIFVTKHNANLLLDTLKYFVMITVNIHEYKLTSLHSFCQADMCHDRGITKQGGASMCMKNKQLAKEIAMGKAEAIRLPCDT